MKYERVERLRQEHDYKIKQVAAALELNRDVYARYEKGIRDLPIAYAIRLAQYYDVTVDYLLGVTDEKRSFGQ